MAVKRDRRLAAAIVLFALSAAAGTYQALVIAHFVDAAVLGQWSWFAETYSAEVPASGPNEFCFDWCAPELPFLAGWLSLGTFLLGFVLITLVWWRPKR